MSCAASPKRIRAARDPKVAVSDVQRLENDLSQKEKPDGDEQRRAYRLVNDKVAALPRNPLRHAEIDRHQPDGVECHKERDEK